MRAQHHAARQGLAWISGGLALYRKKPFVLAANVTLGWVLLLFASILILPVITVGVFKVCRQIERDELVFPGSVMTGIQQRPAQLLLLGVLYLVLSLLFFKLGNLLDGGVLAAALEKIRTLDDPTLRSPAVMRSLLLRTAVFVPVIALCAFAPVITALRNTPPIKAVFFSIIAFSRNLAPLLVGGLAFLALFMFVPTMLAIVGTALSPAFGVMLYLLALLAVIPLAGSSFYVAARDILPELTDAPAAP